MVAINTLISDNQIVVRSIKKDLSKEEWDEGNVDFGAIWRKNYIILNPLVDDSFGSWFFIDQTSSVETDINAQRSALIPFQITDVNQFCISTVSESIFLFKDETIDIGLEKQKGKSYPLNLDDSLIFQSGDYLLHFQVCIGTNDLIPEEEVYYRFNFIKTDHPEFKVLVDDDYGWTKNSKLIEGKY